MKIISLQAENIKRLKAVEIIPKENTVIITGKNGEGKSSVLDAIWYALGGGDATKDTVRPIRDGEKTAITKVDLGDLVVSRNWTSNESSYLKVENKDGAKYSSPQKMLDELVGILSFDPLEFSGMDSKEQLQTLFSLVTLEIDPQEIEEQKREIYDERTVLNREMKSLQGQLEGLKEPKEGLPEKEVSVADVIAEYQAASNQLSQNNDLRNEFKKIKELYNQEVAVINSLKENIAKLELELVAAQKNLEETRSSGKRMGAEVEKLHDPDLDSFKTKLAQTEETNDLIRIAQRYREIKNNLLSTKKNSQALSDKITALDQKKQDAIKKAKFPIEGLGFTEEGVTYSNIPFKQCSSAEQLRVSLAMAMAINPKLRVILIKDGSLLDSGNLKAIGEMAKDNDYQVWIERVSDGKEGVGIVIEDGMVK